jgi:uncharacterized integral membrane protein
MGWPVTGSIGTTTQADKAAALSVKATKERTLEFICNFQGAAYAETPSSASGRCRAISLCEVSRGNAPGGVWQYPTLPSDNARMRWILIMVLALVVIEALRPWLSKLGLGRLPGDFRFKLFGREWNLPIGSSMLLSFVAIGIGYII